jgi:hypothetical protein
MPCRVRSAYAVETPKESDNKDNLADGRGRSVVKHELSQPSLLFEFRHHLSVISLSAALPVSFVVE